MNLADIKTIESIIKTDGFHFKKSLGQNFLINPDVCPAMANTACDGETGVIEIGPGIGVLTCELAKRAKKVVTIELDEHLRKILNKTLAEFDNIKIIYGDAMKMDLAKLISEEFPSYKRVTVCANLPYYITSPVIMSLLESKLPLDSITVMVQKEAAERLCAEVGSRAAGAVTAAVCYYAESEILFNVDRNSFMPPPKVDSAVIQLKIRETPPISVKNEEMLFKFVKSCFAQRRKTLVNTVSNTLDVDKEKLKDALNKQGINVAVRSEQLTMEQLANLSNQLFD